MLVQWQSNEWIGGQSQVPADYVLKQTEPSLNDLAAPVSVFPIIIIAVFQASLFDASL